MITTLNKIRARSPCLDGWQKLLRHMNKTAADDEPLSIVAVLDSNGLDDALWCLRAVEGYDREIRLYAIWCARQVQHLMADPRGGLAILELADRFARGRASDTEFRRAAAAAAAAAEAWGAAAGAAAAEEVEAWAAAAEAAAAGAAAAEAWGAAAEEESAAQAAELRRICEEIEAGRDPYPEEAQP